MFSFPNVFVSLSEKANLWAKNKNPLVKSVVIPDGVDIDKFNPHGDKAKIPLKHPIVLSVGALEEGKRHKLIIDAVAKTKASLLILGKGNLREKLSSYGKNKLGNRFIISNVDYSEIPNNYRACDIFTSASGAWYSFEMVILEAMASNLPVVVNKDIIRDEIIGDAGFSVDPQKVNDYAKIIENTLNTNWGNKPRIQAEKYSWDLVSKKYEKLFLTLI